MRLHEVIAQTYPEVEFVCHNEQYPDSTHLDSQQALERDLRNMEGIVVLRQDWSNEHDGRQISLSAIVLDRSLLQQVKDAARRHGVKIDMINKVDNDYVDRAVRGEHDGQIKEGRFSRAAAAGVAAAALTGAVGGAAKISQPQSIDEPPRASIDHLIRDRSAITSWSDIDLKSWWEKQQDTDEEGYNAEGWASTIASTYRINAELSQKIVNLAIKYEDEVFPTAADILAVIAVESSFNPRAVSRLEDDPARGLMQVRPGVWKIDPKELNSVENQIRIGVRILKKYYDRTGSEEGAIQAYNIGITNFRKGQENPAYLAKVMREKENLFNY
jgi:soluble lytic murein transglycosylase-like protein